MRYETMVNDTKHFEEGTPVRCNCCGAIGAAPREFEAAVENNRCWRIQDMFTHTECRHMDAHWVYKSDI